MGECWSSAQIFGDAATAARQMAVQEWLSVEDDEGALAATANDNWFHKAAADSDERGAHGLRAC